MPFHPTVSLLSGAFVHFVHKRAKLLQCVTVGEAKSRKASFIMVSEALSCHRPHDRVIKQEMSNFLECK